MFTRKRSVILVIIFSIITFGIYYVYKTSVVIEELGKKVGIYTTAPILVVILYLFKLHLYFQVHDINNYVKMRCAN